MSPVNKAMRRARKIPMAKTYKDKCKAVHAWHKAIVELLNGTK